MPQRKSPANSNTRVSPQQFCWLCVCFLGTLLVVQVCVLLSLLRRLAEIQHLTAEQASDYASAASTLSQERSFSNQVEPVLLRLPESDFVAVASALGAGPDELRIFVTTFQRAVPSGAHLVVLIDDADETEAKFKDTGDSAIDLQRLTFHRVSAGEAWSTLPTSDAQFYHFYAVLQGLQAKIVQISEVEGIAFQANPFVWASAQAPGVHLFADNTLVGDAKTWPALSMCFGTEAERLLGTKPTIASNYLIGTKSDVQRYLFSILDKISAAACNKRGVAAAAANFVAQTEGAKVFIHNGQTGPVWNGEAGDKDFNLDSEDHVINQDGYQYAVLRSYDQHQELWKSLQRQFGKSPPDFACSTFQVEDGDMTGHDLTHSAAESESECCSTCQKVPGCSAFIFSPSRKHCWLKSVGGIRIQRPGSDMRCGLRINGQV